MAKSDFHYSHRLRVRWSEVDRQGVVFFGNYLNYFDVAMTEYMRDLDYPYPQGLLARGTDLQVIKAAVQYASAVRFDDLLALHTRLVQHRVAVADSTAVRAIIVNQLCAVVRGGGE